MKYDKEKIAEYHKRKMESDDDLHGLLEELESEYFDLFGEEVPCIGFTTIDEVCDTIFEAIVKKKPIEKMPDYIVF